MAAWGLLATVPICMAQTQDSNQALKETMAPISGAIHPIEAAATDWHYGAYVRKDATKVSRWGMELGIQAGRDSEEFAFLVDEKRVDGADVLRSLS